MEQADVWRWVLCISRATDRLTWSLTLPPSRSTESTRGRPPLCGLQGLSTPLPYVRTASTTSSFFLLPKNNYQMCRYSTHCACTFPHAASPPGFLSSASTLRAASPPIAPPGSPSDFMSASSPPREQRTDDVNLRVRHCQVQREAPHPLPLPAAVGARPLPQQVRDDLRAAGRPSSSVRCW